MVNSRQVFIPSTVYRLSFIGETMFIVKKQRRRRSELRLGAPTINYETTPTEAALLPVSGFWQKRVAQIVGLVILVLLGITFYILFTNPAFFVLTAEIRGNSAVSAREIYAISQVDRQSIFWINPTQVVERIMSLPNIKAATVSLTLPARVIIQVAERRPELLWQTNQTIWWVDEEGVIVPPKQDLSGMLRIIDDDRRRLQPGYQIDADLVTGAQTLRILAPNVEVMRYSRARGLTVATPEGWPIYLGDGYEIKAKLVVLTALLADLKARNIIPAYVDVRDPLRPVYKPTSVIQIGKPAIPSAARPTPVPQ
jgi:cell division protein FtsQ